MYDNIFLLNRVKLNGVFKKGNYSLMNNSVKLVLLLIMTFIAVLFVVVYGSIAGARLTIDLFFETVLSSAFLKLDLVFFCCILGFYYLLNKRGSHLVSFKVENDLLVIVFTEGLYQGIEYRLFLDDISNICIYKNGVCSFYCNHIEIDKNGKTKEIKGTIKFYGGDSNEFLLDLQDYMGRKIKFRNKKD